jgi:hypothetical protein
MTCGRSISRISLRAGDFAPYIPFGTTPEFWVNLQAQYELEVADRTAGKTIAREVVPLAA